jgi:hypothetical protein
VLAPEPSAKPARAARESSGPSVTSVLGERPRAPWHPLPLSELLILVGAVATVIGLQRGSVYGRAPLFAGLAAVGIGTIEVTLREHLSGYRSHATLLSVIPVLALDTALVLVIALFARVPRGELLLLLLAIDLALFVPLFKYLRARFLDARHARALEQR